MPLTPGSKLGQYEVLAPLGAGGMGEVYRARDSRLQRDVAVKALPDEFARDPERLARFEREAKLLASLSHANVAGIFGLEEVEDHRYLILEFVEGETLAARLDRGPLSIEDALQIGRQVAAALEAAHENGIVHRDLKPGNVMITPSGDVKVLDFGLAKGGMGSASGSDVNLSHSPTLTRSPTVTNDATGAGVILGTAAYMSPEQARGRAVDKRTDIWSFGCVLYECLVGRQAFMGDTVSDLIARILEREPDWDALPSRTPSRVRSLLRRCLEKDVRRRLRDIGDARIEIEDVISTRSSSPAGGAARAGRSRRRTWLGALALVLITVVATRFAISLLDRAPAARPARFEIPQMPGTQIVLDGAGSCISPDGQTLAYVARDSTKTAWLWVRPLESLVARPLPGTRDASLPFWSPDSKSIGFFVAGKKLMKVAVDGGSPEAVADVTGARGGTWNRDGVILFAPVSEGTLYRVSANGGEPVQVTTLDSTETAHRFPCFLPDGNHFLYSSLPPHDGKFTIYEGSLDSKTRHVVLTTAGSGVCYAEPGYLIYQRDDVLVAQKFDTKKGRVVGEPISLGDRPLGTNYSGAPPLSVATNGTLAYYPNRPFAGHLVWTDMNGKTLEDVPMVPGPYGAFDLSPDGRQAVLTRFEGVTRSNLWMVDLERGVVTRFSYENGQASDARWSPDGTRIAYAFSTYGGTPKFVVVSVGAGSSTESFLESDPSFKFLSGWTPDGHSLVYGRQQPATQLDIWILPVDGKDPTPRPYLATPFFEDKGAVSPDGHWMSYDSNESGQTEVYVQSFPAAGAKYQVTTRGGTNKGWSTDGRQLYFTDLADPTTLYAADVLPGASFRLGPARVIAHRPPGAFASALWTPARGSARQLVLVPAGPRPTGVLTIVEHWPSLLNQKD